MALIHQAIVRQLEIDFSVDNRGRLFEMKQGYAIPKGGKHPINFGSVNGFPDLFGDEICIICDISDSCKYMPCSGCIGQFKQEFPVPCYIEVKTIAYPKLSKDQVNFMNAQKARGAKCYVAMENEDKSEKLYSLREWEIE